MNKRKQERGAALVEFAIVVPLLLALMFGFAEIGRALYQQNTLTKAVIAGARYLARSNNTLNTPDCSATAIWSGYAAKAKNLVVYGATAGTGAVLVPNLAIAGVSISHNRVTEDGIDACVIRVSASFLFAGVNGDGKTVPAALLGVVPDITLNAAGEERYIGL